MHGIIVNEAILTLRISPDGPILIKAGEALSGVRPELPDMAFVRTHYSGRETVYLPGSSLKGVIRSHCERIARTVGGTSAWSCDPLARGSSCSDALPKHKDDPPAKIYADSCFICRLFGHTSMASHIHFADAVPATPRDTEALPDPNATEERNGVAIDRVYGSVAQGPFQFETVVQGVFETTLTLRNFSCAHLGLLGLALRDLDQQRVMIGFGKSRGLGRVKVGVGNARFRRYWELPGETQRLVGFLHSSVGQRCGWAFASRPDDILTLPASAQFSEGLCGQHEATVIGALDGGLWPAAVKIWKAFSSPQ